jgi:hypothetical protein
MTVRERIMAALTRAEGPICDDHLARMAGLRYRQQANSLCSQLAREGLILRKRGQCSECVKEGKKNAKLVNVVLAVGDASLTVDLGTPAPPRDPPPLGSRSEVSTGCPWYWEGNVQACLVAWLTGQGYEIRRVADTASREHGPDIIAVKDGKELRVSVKGYPEGGKPTRPTVQGRHWFAHAVFEALLHRDEDPDVHLAMAFPDFRTYRRLARRIEWLRTNLPLGVYWVQQCGEVKPE